MLNPKSRLVQEFSMFPTGFWPNRPNIGQSQISGDDAVLDGQNFEHNEQLQWQVRKGYIKWMNGDTFPTRPLNAHVLYDTTAAIGVRNYIDDATSLFEVTPSAKTAIYTKANADMLTYASVSSTLYMTNGKAGDYRKRISNGSVKQWGITAPTAAPTVLVGPGGGTFRARIGYKYTFTYKDSTDGHCSTAPVVSTDTDNFLNKLYLKVTGPYSAESRVNTIEIYRSKDGGGAQFFLTSAPYNNVTPAACTAAAGSAGNVDNGTHSWVITFENALGLETQSGSKSNVLTIAGGAKQVNLTAIPLGPTGTTSRNVYRTKAGDTGNWFFVGTVADNITTTFTDNVSDASLPALFANATGWQLIDTNLDSVLTVTKFAPLSNVNDPPPAGLDNIVNHNGRLFGSIANKVYWSAGIEAFNGVGEECWPPLNFLPFPANVNKMVSSSLGLVVGTEAGLYLITGSSTSDFSGVPFLPGYPVINFFHLVADGDFLFVLTGQGQILKISNTVSDVGFPIYNYFRTQAGNIQQYMLCVVRNGTQANLWLKFRQVRTDAWFLIKMNLNTERWSTPFLGAAIAQTTNIFCLQSDTATFDSVIGGNDTFLSAYESSTLNAGVEWDGTAIPNPSLLFDQVPIAQAPKIASLDAVSLEWSGELPNGAVPWSNVLVSVSGNPSFNAGIDIVPGAVQDPPPPAQAFDRLPLFRRIYSTQVINDFTLTSGTVGRTAYIHLNVANSKYVVLHMVRYYATER